MKTIHGFFAAFLMLGFAILPMPARADADAQKFLEAIYKKYVGQNPPGVIFDTSEAALAYFTPELAAMISSDAESAQKNDEPPILDGDPFVGAQDWDIKNLAITVKDIAPGRAIGLVSFANMGERQTVELDLKKLPQGWRIDDIRWSEGSLREILKNEGGAPGEKESQDTQKL
jgi:hypothetical protein